MSDPAPPGPILVVEDSKADLYLIREALDEAEVGAALHVAVDGEQAIRYLDAVDQDSRIPCPRLVLLDINLPRRSGHEVIRRVRASRRCGQVAVVVVTSSDSDRDRAEMSRHGVAGYFRKPSEYRAFLRLGAVVREVLGLPGLGEPDPG